MIDEALARDASEFFIARCSVYTEFRGEFGMVGVFLVVTPAKREGGNIRVGLAWKTPCCLF